MTKSRHILPPRTVWTPEQEAMLIARYPHEKTARIAADLGFSLDKTYRKANKLGLSKTEAYLASPEACRLRQGDNVGLAYRFKKGQIPPNKGIKGINYPGMQATQFKPGQRPHTWKPIGTERYSKEGYLQVKIKDTGVSRRDYVAVHQLVWHLHYGAVPDKYHVSFKDGNKKNIVIKNLKLISFADMMKRNTLHNNPKEITELIQLRGVINRKINRRLKDEQRNHPA